jgi:NADH-quinone oxidoreductase subunit L
MTFGGKPRDHHVYEHAHESKLMYVPLIVLMVGTVWCSYFLFRPMIADAARAATNAVNVVTIDGMAEKASEAGGQLIVSHEAHNNLAIYVGLAWLIGIGLAFFLYKNGLETAGRIAKAAGPVYTALCEKLYFDHVYNFVFVRGCVGLAYVSRFIDTYIIDLFYNLSAAITERLAAFSGQFLDAQGVDGFVNGLADFSQKVGNAVRKPQTGRIRNYVLFAAASATVIVLVVLYLNRTPAEVPSPVPEGLLRLSSQ